MTRLPPILDVVVLGALRQLPSTGGSHMLAAIADLYSRDAPPLLLQMETASVVGDFHALRRSAHALKSYAGNIGANTLVLNLKSLELAAQLGDAVACMALLPSLQTLSADALAALLVEAAVS
jgi:HPt (histidine-containing phosphotransfer) domain-containing protein